MGRAVHEKNLFNCLHFQKMGFLYSAGNPFVPPIFRNGLSSRCGDSHRFMRNCFTNAASSGCHLYGSEEVKTLKQIYTI